MFLNDIYSISTYYHMDNKHTVGDARLSHKYIHVHM